MTRDEMKLNDWKIDNSAGRPILTYKGCSVIEAEDAEFVLGAIKAALSAAEPVKPYGYVYESTVRYFDGRSPQRKVDFSYTKKNISDDDIEEFEISETAVYSALSAQVQDVATRADAANRGYA